LHGFPGDDGGLSGDEGRFDVRARRDGQPRSEAERENSKKGETGESHDEEVGGGKARKQTGQELKRLMSSRGDGWVPSGELNAQKV